MADPSLDRLLARYEFGALSPIVVEIELRAVLERLSDAIVVLAPRADTVRLWSGELLPARDEAFTRASRATTLLEFREAVRQIRRCREVMASTVRLIEAVDAADRAAGPTDALWSLAGTPRLRGLPSIAALAQIIDVARSMIIERNYIQAAVAAGICRRMAESLARREALEPEARAAADERLRALDELCAATRSFAVSGDDDPAHDGSLDALRSLLGRDHAPLGLRLLVELEIQMASRRRFLDYCVRRHHGAFTESETEALRRSVRERSWDGAVDEQWNRSIAEHAGAIARQRRRIDAAAAALEASLKGPENESRTEVA